MADEVIEINGKKLQYGVLGNDDGSYQVYLYPGMTVAELAFNIMVTIRLLEQGGYIKNKKEFDSLVRKYYVDPQYAPVEKNDAENTSKNS